MIRFNGDSDPRLQAIAAAEREQRDRRNGNGHDWQAPPWEHALEKEFPELDLVNPAPPIERQWAVSEWFPMLETVGFGGPAGEGKTLLACMFATASALGTGALGLPFAELKAALVLCEDRPNDALLRQRDICRAFGCQIADLADRLLVLPRRDCEHNYLAIFDRDGELHLTTFFHQLLARLKEFGAKFVVIDGRSDVFWGNQNDERHARLFVRQVTDRIARELGVVVVLIYHPSRKGRVDGTGESGSVQWDSAFRARLILEPAGTDDDPDTRRLVRKKSNFAAKNEEIQIRWDKGVFIRTDEPDPDKTPLDRAIEGDKANRVFLQLLDKFTQQQRPTSSSPTSSFYAPKQFAKERTAEGVKEPALEKAMRALFDEEAITNAPDRSRRIVKIVRANVRGGAPPGCAHTLPPVEIGESVCAPTPIEDTPEAQPDLSFSKSGVKSRSETATGIEPGAAE